MGNQNAREYVNGGTITLLQLSDSTLPDYLIKNITLTGDTVVIVNSMLNGVETGTHYMVGIIAYSGTIVPIDNWKKMLLENLIPENVIDEVEKYFSPTESE